MFFNNLKKMGVLGINSRNLDYIFKYNKRVDYPDFDNKVKTKEIARSAGIPVPETYMIIKHHRQVNQIENLHHNQFVIKPARGTGGGGILIITGKNRFGFTKSSGQIIDLDHIKYHLYNIISGIYSFSGISDQAIIEYKVHNHKTLDKICYKGVCDIRIVCYKQVPVMAMIRVPTNQSDGKANLHLGGIGVGIKIGGGLTTHAMHSNKFIEFHPENAENLIGIKIPHWNEILNMTVNFAQVSKIGYLGLDIVIDEKFGPMIIEANVRPGIAIQIANNDGLKRRLDLIDNANLTTKSDKLDFAIENF